MIDFDPNTDPDSQEQVDAYVDWCATNYARLSTGSTRTYRTALRCAQWLFVISVAQIHLDDDVEENREALLTQFVMYFLLARALERQRQHFAVDRLLSTRSTLDCWEATGEWADHLLIAAKCALAALILIELNPLVDLWELSCPEVWALLDVGAASLAEINVVDVDSLTFADFSVQPAEMVLAKFTWQRANNIDRNRRRGATQ
jgi:hypothetical protein